MPSSDTIGKGDKVTIYCLSEYGLSREVFYTVKYTTTGDKPTSYWYTLQTDSENSVIEFIPENLNTLQKTGEYTFKVEAFNILENGKRYTATKTFVVNVGDPFKNTSSVYHTFHPVGERVYVDCNAEGGMGASTNDILFSIYYKPSTSDTWTTIMKKSRRSSNMYFVPKTAGQYDVRVEAFDMVNDQVAATAVKDITVIAYNPLVNTSNVSSHSGYTSEPIIANCSAEGGIGNNIVYTVYYKKSYDNNWTVLQNESKNNTASFTSVTTATYKIRVIAVNIVEGYDEHIEVYKDFEVKVDKKHIHSYGEPVWSWSDDHTSAKAAFTCTDGDDTQTLDAVVTKSEETDKIVYTATVEFGGKTYTDTYTEQKEETYVYYPAAKPYIDDEGAYILGYKEHYRYKGKYYAVNNDKSVGEETDDIWISYFKFALLPDDTYAIEYYTGATKNLTEIVIPKTFNGRKITVLGTDNLDVFIKAGKPQFELVLNENITEIKSCAFNKIGVTKVTGDTSGLCKIGEYAFSWVNKTGGYALDITFAYPGTITTGDAIFNHVNATLHLGHGTTFSNTDFRATSLTYDFNDGHTYGKPTWEWADDHSSAKAVFTCTDARCKHTVIVNEKNTMSEDNHKMSFTAEAIFDGVTYTDTNFTLTHSGTESDPYLIYTPEEFNEYLVNKAYTGKYIRICRDMTLDPNNGSNYVIDKDTVLNLNNHIITLSNTSILVDNCSLTIDETIASGKITSNDKRTIIVNETGSLDIEFGSIVNTNSADDSSVIENNGITVMNGGWIQGSHSVLCNSKSSRLEINSGNVSGTFLNNEGTITVKGDLFDFNPIEYVDLTQYEVLQIKNLYLVMTIDKAKDFDPNSFGGNSERSIVVPDPESAPKTGETASAAAVAAILLTSLTTVLFLAMKRRKGEDE